MIRVTFIKPDGAAVTLEARPGGSLMQLALDNGIPGIIGECGGAMACATCHCHVDPDWRERSGTASEDENAMLEFASGEIRPESRLACQITLAAELDGLVIRLP